MGHFHKKHPYRRTNWKSKVLVLILFLVILGYLGGALDLKGFSWDNVKEKVGNLGGNNTGEGVIKLSLSNKVSIKELNQNPDSYINQNISIKGELNDRLGGYSIEGSGGYWIWIEDNCIEDKREYNYNSQTYSAKGVWRSPEEKPRWSPFHVTYEYRLSCTSPLS